jgi:hypothetical protein
VMKLYCWVWRIVWLAISVVPVSVGVSLASPVALFCLGSIVAAVVAATGQPAKTWLASGLLGAAVVAGLWSAGELGVALLALAGVTAPPVVARVGELLGRQHPRHELTNPGSQVRELDPEPLLSAHLWAGPVQALTDDQLVLSWSESFAVLKLTRTIHERLELVNLRQAYLDELESRNATGFDSWLRCRPSPIGIPQSYIEVREAHLDAPSGPTDDGRGGGSEGSNHRRTEP